MNILDKLINKEKIELNKNEILFENFKKEQYKLIDFFLKNCINYISNFSKNPIVYSGINIKKDYKYEHLFGYSLEKIELKIKDPNKKRSDKVFLTFTMPELIDGDFFFLNGSYYSPTCYCLDKPISIKKNSIKITGLFTSITIYSKDQRAIFIGDNIPISYLLDLFEIDDILRDEFEKENKIKSIRHKKENVIKYFSSLYNCEGSYEKIIEVIESLILDEYTKELYSICYKDILPKKISIKDILTLAITRSFEKQPSFVDLQYKRLVFIELLLAPVFKKFTDVAIKMFKNGIDYEYIEIHSDDIVKNFTNKLKNKFLYDSANLFSGILTHKISMMNPGSDRSPSSIASCDPTHFGKICPITVSAQKTGETVSIVPNIKINKYGLFLDE